MCKCCKCCSFDSLGCRLRTLKAFGAILFVFGTLFALAGIAIGFLSDLYFNVISLPDVFPEYILYSYLVVSTGVVAVGTGVVAIYIAKTMTDDDWSTRGLGVLALLTIVCSLASVGVPAWPLYENGYFFGIPPQTSTNMTPSTDMTTPLAVTTVPMTTVPITTTPLAVTTVPMTTVETDTTTNATVTNGTADNSTASGGVNMTSPNVTAENMTTPNVTAPNVTSPNATAPNVTSPNVTSSNMTSDNSSSSGMMTTPEVTSGTVMDTTGNSTVLPTTREPIDFDEWLLLMAPFGIVSLFAFIFILLSLFICCIACCCPERSEIVDDMELYKT
ncbi:uncharacterized protein PB18E9.04c-like isoform X1 [Lytechinus variegatus]|uniref:uncharacterized protein PB18E9.04c-like isoform X1 n=1 Tax=Lytechinus variegatus TaxID=7654 RepID=UPI001BB25B86|nr:uncharacterized protein PB18E9.04c-like isoform X1 [Lytechinus variegatus]